MPVEQKQTKTTRRRYSPGFKTEAFGLAEQVGVAGAAKQLGLRHSTTRRPAPAGLWITS